MNSKDKQTSLMLFAFIRVNSRLKSFLICPPPFNNKKAKGDHLSAIAIFKV